MTEKKNSTEKVASRAESNLHEIETYLTVSRVCLRDGKLDQQQLHRLKVLAQVIAFALMNGNSKSLELAYRGLFSGDLGERRAMLVLFIEWMDGENGFPKGRRSALARALAPAGPEPEWADTGIGAYDPKFRGATAEQIEQALAGLHGNSKAPAIAAALCDHFGQALGNATAKDFSDAIDEWRDRLKDT